MADLTVNHMRREHQAARKVAARFETLLDELDQGFHSTAERSNEFNALQDFLTGPLALLIRKEDEILYPALGGLFALDEGPIAVLRGEHGAMTAHLQEALRIAKSLRADEVLAQDLRKFSREARRGIEILQDHLYKEERVLFPMVARHLTPERDVELLKKMESLGSPSAPHDKREPYLPRL